MRVAFERALRVRAALGLPSAETNAFRAFHGAADGIPWVTVDVYGDYLVASMYTETLGAREHEALDALAELPFAGVYLKHRPRQANVLRDEERIQRAPHLAVRGASATEPYEVRELDVPYLVLLGDGLSTGLFLDQRDNRGRLRREARDRTVLNLFSYTCAFGLAAALGGARATTNIDVAKNVLGRGRANYEHAGVALDAHRFLARDVLDALPRMARAGERYDVVVLDPPSYASTRRGRFSVERDYHELVQHAAGVVAPGGRMLACTNHHALDPTAFAAALREGVARAGRRLGDLEIAPPPADHPVERSGIPHLKSAWLRLEA